MGVGGAVGYERRERGAGEWGGGQAAGKDGVPLQTLFGFERVHVPAGQSVDVNIYPALTDFMHTALDGTKTAAAGEWKVKFGVAETQKHGMGYAEVKLTTV